MIFPTVKTETLRLQTWIFALFTLIALPLGAQQPVPAPTNEVVNDYAGLLSRQEDDQLTRKLAQYARQTSTQIVIVTEPSLEGGDPFNRALEYYEAWGIGGSREKSNGALIYVARDDRKVRIMTGYGAEGFLPDALAKRIIDEIITPNFREGRYYRGLDRATSAIMELAQGEYTNDTTQQADGKQEAKGGIPAILVILFVIILIVVLSRMGGGGDDDDDGGYYRGGRYDMDRRRRGRRGGGWMIFPFPWIGGGGGWSGGGGGGLSGGGGGDWGDFGGFGGGLTGGGGAGGEW